MSKERAQRRAAREKEAAIVASARASEAERRERKAARTRALKSRLPQRRSPTTGVLAQRRRKQTGVTIAMLLVLNLFVWLVFPPWSARAMVLVVSLLAAPVLHTIMFRRP